MNEHEGRIDALSELGLTDLEANIYNTLSSMAMKGLVLTSLQGTTSIYIPTPLEEYLEQYSRKMKNLMEKTREVFRNIDLNEENSSPECFNWKTPDRFFRRLVYSLIDLKAG